MRQTPKTSTTKSHHQHDNNNPGPISQKPPITDYDTQQYETADRSDSIVSMASIRQESELMDELRQIEESEAKEQLNIILDVCQTVS
jgi:hypothetical protein